MINWNAGRLARPARRQTRTVAARAGFRVYEKRSNKPVSPPAEVCSLFSLFPMPRSPAVAAAFCCHSHSLMLAPIVGAWSLRRGRGAGVTGAGGSGAGARARAARSSRHSRPKSAITSTHSIKIGAIGGSLAGLCCCMARLLLDVRPGLRVGRGQETAALELGSDDDCSLIARVATFLLCDLNESGALFSIKRYDQLSQHVLSPSQKNNRP